MRTVTECLEEAEKCRVLAEQATDSNAEEGYVMAAESWELAAESRELIERSRDFVEFLGGNGALE